MRSGLRTRNVTRHPNVCQAGPLAVADRLGGYVVITSALAQRVEVDAREGRIMGSRSELLRALVAASNAKTASFGEEIRTPHRLVSVSEVRTVLVATSAQGQIEKNSMRAKVFRFAPESGPCARQSALRICATFGLTQRSIIRSAVGAGQQARRDGEVKGCRSR
jgi:hypothetical protein